MRDHETMLLNMFKDCDDVVSVRFPTGERSVLLLYCTGLLDSQQLHEFVLPRIEHHFQALNLILLNGDDRAEQAIKRVFAGQLLICDDGALYALDISNPPKRQPEESNMEVTIKGAKDGFTEDLTTNVALVRKRLRTNKLCCEKMTIGDLSQTEVALLYMKNLAKPEVIEEARKRLTAIRTDVSSIGFLEEALGGYSESWFPLVETTTRPDYAMFCLANGRFIVMMDGVPSGVIAPATLALQLKSPEDEYNPYFIAALGRFLRYVGLAMSIFVPGFWIALATYHPEQLPMPMLATVTLSRLGLPMSTVFEAFFMQLMFELFREAGMRLPSVIGQTVAVVGGLIVGDAAIRAGLTSPSMLVISALSAVATFTLVNPSLNGTVTLLRFIVMGFAAFVGFFGFFIAVFGIILYLCCLHSYGVPYLSPFAPLQPKQLISAALKKPRRYAKDHPAFVSEQQRKGGNKG